jgi:hypothetical protein
VAAQTIQHDLENGSTVQGQQCHKADHRKAATGFLTGRLRITYLVSRSIGQLDGGAIDHFDGATAQLAVRADTVIGGLGRWRSGLFAGALWANAGGLGCRPNHPPGLDGGRADAGGFGFEQLPDEAFESQAQTEDAFPAVDSVILGGEERRRQKITQVFLELGQGGLADG